MKTFKSKPTFLKAIKWDGTEESAVEISKMNMGYGYTLEYINGKLNSFGIKSSYEKYIKVNINDYIVITSNGSLDVVNQEKFELSFEEVKE